MEIPGFVKSGTGRKREMGVDGVAREGSISGQQLECIKGHFTSL